MSSSFHGAGHGRGAHPPPAVLNRSGPWAQYDLTASRSTTVFQMR